LRKYLNGSISSTFVLELYAKSLQGESDSLKKYSAPGSMGPFLKALQWTLNFPGTLHWAFWNLWANYWFGICNSSRVICFPRCREKCDCGGWMDDS